MQSLAAQLPGRSETFAKQMLRIVFKFSGEPQTEDVIERIYSEALENENLVSPSSSEQVSELP